MSIQVLASDSIAYVFERAGGWLVKPKSGYQPANARQRYYEKMVDEAFPPEDLLASVVIANQETVQSFARSVVKGAVGGLLFGPVGTLVGALAGKRTDVTFIATFKDGRTFLGQTDSGTFTRLQAATFGVSEHPNAATTEQLKSGHGR